MVGAEDRREWKVWEGEGGLEIEMKWKKIRLMIERAFIFRSPNCGSCEALFILEMEIQGIY
jgi:hypothetical protein